MAEKPQGLNARMMRIASRLTIMVQCGERYVAVIVCA